MNRQRLMVSVQNRRIAIAVVSRFLRAGRYHEIEKIPPFSL